MLNKEATEHYITEKVHLYVQAAIQHCTYKNKCQYCTRRYPVCAGGNPALYIHYKNKCQYCTRRYPVCAGGNPALYIHYKNKCQYCTRRYPICAGGNPALQMLVNQVQSTYIITQPFLLSLIIVAHLFPHTNVVPPLHIITFESEGSRLWKFDVTQLKRCTTNWAFAASKRSCTFKVAICPTANESFLVGAFIFVVKCCTHSIYIGLANRAW